MSITIADIQTNFNTYIGDSSTDRISAAERLQYFNEATVWVQEELGNDLQNYTQKINYYDTVNYYKVTTDIADLLTGGDLRREKNDQYFSFTPTDSRELAEMVGQEQNESAWAIERRDTDTYMAINHNSKHIAKIVSDFDSATSGGGTWALDTTNSDATNLTVDTNEFKQGSASLNFDADVSQSGNNRLTLINSTITAMDLSDQENLASWLLWVYVPDVTEFTSVTIFWGSDSSNYWSATATTDMDGASFSNGWNRIRVAWEDATATSSPDVENVDWLRIDLNYGAGQGDDTDFRVDYLILSRPEILTFHYQTWKVGVDTSGDDILVFGATTDVPYFSGMYDQLKYPVARMAASLAYRDLRLTELADREEQKAERQLSNVRRLIPSSRVKEVKSFKVKGVSFAARNRGRRGRIR